MRTGVFLSAKTCVAALVTLLFFLAILVLMGGGATRSEWRSGSQASLLKPTGSPQLISVEPLPSMDGEICEWVPASPPTPWLRRASTGINAAEAFAQESRARKPSAAGARTRSENDVDRPPARLIRDSYATYSAVAVDLHSNEVFLEDENLFGIKVFNRTDNTPPGAKATEPKRTLGGLQTKLEFNCGLYIDPNSGDVYSVNNDTIDRTVVFPRDAKGNARPMRELHTPHGSFGIAVDEDLQELYLTVQHTNAVVVYRKMAQGEEKPLRTLRGIQTHLEDPHGIALDKKNGWIFVSNHGNVRDPKVPGSGRSDPPSVSVYPLKASGDTAPVRIIQGPQTQLNWPAAMFMDAERGELYVANDAGDSILVFRATDSGDAAPLRAIQGAHTQIKFPTGVFLDTKNDELWVSNMGNHRATVYPRTANGDVAPKRQIRSAPQEKLALAIGNPGAVGYDSKREQILVPN